MVCKVWGQTVTGRFANVPFANILCHSANRKLVKQEHDGGVGSKPTFYLKWEVSVNVSSGEG